MLGRKETTPTDRIDILIAPETHFRGKIVSRGTLRIDGWVEGEISTEGDVIIGESGCVSAQIRARNILVAGKVKGNLMPAGRVEIAATASLEGNIQVELSPEFDSCKAHGGGFRDRGSRYHAGLGSRQSREGNRHTRALL